MARRLHEIRALELALALEILWAAFLVYDVHWRRLAGSVPWNEQVLFVSQVWAGPAIAIVVVVWVVRAVRA
jgi:hypothetical protein